MKPDARGRSKRSEQEPASGGAEKKLRVPHASAGREEAGAAWQIVSDLPGRVRFRHSELRRNGLLARRVEVELAGAAGIREWHLRPTTGSLLVHYDSRAISRSQIGLLLERAIEEPVAPAQIEGHPTAVSFGLANGSIALAAAGELALPILLPASALLLLASNTRVMSEALRELRAKHVGLPTLFTTIIAGTLATGQFLTASMMSWMLAFWRQQHRSAQFRLRRELLPPITQRPRFARLDLNGPDVTVPSEELTPGARIIVNEGEMVPADGLLVGGPALVDESLLRGVPGMSWKAPGDAVYAGSIAADGALALEVTSVGDATLAAQLGRELAAAVGSAPTGLALSPHGEEFARRAVAPTLAAAGVGLVMGDVATAAAILRPDYASGPGIGATLETLADVAACARHGVVIRDSTALRLIAEADIILIDDVPALERASVKTTSVLSLDGTHEAEILRLAATAFHCLADARAGALLAACELNHIAVNSIRANYRGAGIAFDDGQRSICVREARGQDSPSANAPLEIIVDGRLAGVVLFGASSGPHAAEAIRQLRSRRVVVGLLSHRSARDVENLARALEVDIHAGELSSQGKIDLLTTLRRRGRKVAYVGDCARHPDVARIASVAISMSGDPASEQDRAHARILRTDLGWLAPVHEICRAHVDRVRVVHGAILLPNFACVAGAFFGGFTSLSSVVITNLGTLAVYSGLARRRKRTRGAQVNPSSGSDVNSHPANRSSR
jgi:cation transport ATPase